MTKDKFEITYKQESKFFNIWTPSNICALFRGILYVWASGLCCLYRGFRYIEARYIEVLYNEVLSRSCTAHKSTHDVLTIPGFNNENETKKLQNNWSHDPRVVFTCQSYGC